MKKAKYLILAFVILCSLFFVFAPKTFPGNVQFQKISDSPSSNDVIIIFNSGGLGHTPLEEAEDFSSIIYGIKNALDERGYETIIVSYQRTKNSFLGRIDGAKEFFNYFRTQSERLAQDVENFLHNNPSKKIIITGLSGGAVFVDETMKKLSEEAQNKVLAIEVGAPFWQKKFDSENILRLDNENKDSLSKGEAKGLLYSLIKAPFRWVGARISGWNLTISHAFQAPGHIYVWDSPEVGLQITSFLDRKITSF